jgi:hypothetical protein
MRASRKKRICASITLTVHWLVAPIAHDTQVSSSDAKSCRELLESISAAPTTSFAATTVDARSKVRVLDLTNKDLLGFQTALQTAKKSDIVVIDSTRLVDTDFTSALEQGAALFSIAATRASESVPSILAAPMGQPEVIIAIPTTAVGVQKSFGSSISVNQAQVRYMQDMHRRFSDLKHRLLLTESAGGTQISRQVLERARRRSRDAFVLVAHSVQGVMRFPDGSFLSVKDLYETLGARRPAIIISCDTIRAPDAPVSTILTNRQLDFRDIARALKAIEGPVARNSQMALGSVLLILGENMPNRVGSTGRAVKVIGVLVGSVLVVALLFTWECDDGPRKSTRCG